MSENPKEARGEIKGLSRAGRQADKVVCYSSGSGLSICVDSELSLGGRQGGYILWVLLSVSHCQSPFMDHQLFVPVAPATHSGSLRDWNPS